MANSSTSFGGSSSGSSFGPSAPGTRFASTNLLVQFSWGGSTASAPTSIPTISPVTPTFDPKIEANALYGKAMALSVLGFARIGASPAPLVGPYINNGKVDFLVSFGVPADPSGTRVIYAIYLDNEMAWSSVAGGIVPADGTFASEPFDFAFHQGTLTQGISGLEQDHFPGDGNAYRPQMLLEIRNLPFARFMANTGKPVPYVACDIGDTTGGADPLDGINLGEGLERVAHSLWAGYDSNTFEAVNVTDIVPAILIKENINIDQLCQNEAGIYRNLDYLISDKRYIKDHGGNLTADIVFGRDTIVGGEGAIQITRTGPSSQSRELELFKVDPDQDYIIVPSIAKRPRDPLVVSASAGKRSMTLPNVMDAETGQAMATFAMYYDENARKRVSFSATAYGLGIEPSDLFVLANLADGIDNEVWKCTSTLTGANFVTEIEGEATLRCALYGEEDDDPFINNVVLLLGFEGADGSTTITDESPAAHGAATILGNAQIDTAQFKYGASSMLSDGTNDGVTFNDSADWDLSDANSDQFTLEIFAKLTTTTPTERGLMWQGGTNGSLSFFFWIDASGELAFSGFVDGSTATQWIIASSGLVWSTINFYHFAVDKDSTGKVRVYRDGVMVASATPASSLLHNSNQPLRVGTDGSNIRSWPGWLDEARITKGIARYASDSGFTVPAAAFPRP